MKLELDTTGKEALEAVQAVFPDTWKKEIAYAQHRIRVLQKFFSLGIVESVNRFTDHEKDNARRIMMRAAGYMLYLQEGLKEDMSDVSAKLDFVQVQISKINTCRLTDQNRLSVANYYQGKSCRYQTRIKALQNAGPLLPDVPHTYRSVVFHSPR